MAFAGYGDEWRHARQFFHRTFRPDSALRFRQMQIMRAREVIVNLIDDPQHYLAHFATSANTFSILSDSQVFYRFSSSVVMSAVYNYESSARDDGWVVRVRHEQGPVGVNLSVSPN